MALRATASSGFRAPSLAQQSYQAVTSTIINGVFVERGTFPTTSTAAQALGASPLKAEGLHLLQRRPGAAAGGPAGT